MLTKRWRKIRPAAMNFGHCLNIREDAIKRYVCPQSCSPINLDGSIQSEIVLIGLVVIVCLALIKFEASPP